MGRPCEHSSADQSPLALQQPLHSGIFRQVLTQPGTAARQSRSTHGDVHEAFLNFQNA
jgi:hypothetical protein